MRGSNNSRNNTPTRRHSEDGGGTDEDIQPHEDLLSPQMDCGTQMDAGPVQEDQDQSATVFENDQLWGILRGIKTQMEFKLLHRTRDGMRDHYTIGRSNRCDVVISDKRVSSVHCSVYCDYTQATLRIYVEDNSSNGTFINGPGTKLSQKQRTELNSGDEIYVLNPDLPGAVPASAGPFLFINMRDRYAIQKKILHAPDAESLTKRRTIGRHIEDEYIIGEQLGSGMCGQVHRCLHKSTRKQYALKIINTRRFSLSPGLSTKELREEAEIMRKLNHPHIIRIHDAFEMGQTLYIVMELVTGGDLFDKIIELGKYPEDDARRLLIKVMDAVGYLHQMDIVHRDLKPENILLTGSGDPTEVKITDFGLAKRTNQEGLKTFCGTPQYFAPEVLRRKAPTGSDAVNSSYGHKADVWSIGVITYIMLSGSFPFDDDNLFDQIEHAQYSLSGVEWFHVSASAKHFIRSLMNLDINKRLDIKAALEHPWIQEYRARHPTVASESSGESNVVRQRAASVPPMHSSRNGASLPPLPQLHPMVAVGDVAEITQDNDDDDANANQNGQSGRSAAQDIVIKELNMLQKGWMDTNAEDELKIFEPAKPTIFWSNKASLVKLASLRKKISTNQQQHATTTANTPEGNEVGRTSVAVGHKITPQQSTAETEAMLNRATTMSLARRPVEIVEAEKMNFDCAILSPVKASPAADKAEKNSKKRRRKTTDGQLQGKVLSDDDIDCFSDDQADLGLPVQVAGKIATKTAKNMVKRKKSAAEGTAKAHTKVVKKNVIVDFEAASTSCVPAGATSADGLPVKQLEMGQHIPARPAARRNTINGGGKKIINGNQSITNFFAKRVLRTPIPSLPDAFVENSKKPDDDH